MKAGSAILGAAMAFVGFAVGVFMALNPML
ncbi:hypothetical protein J2728_003388 [Caulobacter segnis]|nr:hypothetical protein [Caulobacter segnis]